MNKFYEEINEVLKSYEEFKPYHTKNLSWATDRICWAWKWKKISKEEMEELAQRAENIFNGKIYS